MARDKTRKRTFIVENTWVCSSCGHVNKGRHMKCQNCGSPKEDHEKYDTSGNETAPEVSDSELLKQAKAGANWTCPYCSNDQRDIYDACQRCGANRETVEVRPGVRLDDTMPGIKRPRRKFKGGSYREAPTVLDEPVPENPGGKPKLPENFWRIVGVLALVTAIVSVIAWAFLPHEEHVTVDDVHWVYTAHLQQRKLNHGENWDGNMPSNAFNVSCITQEHGTEDCNPYDCRCSEVTDYCSEPCNCRDSCTTSCSDNGNGYSTCTESCTEVCSTCEVACGSHTECDTCWEQCTVYDEWCEYEYYTWVTLETEHTQGHDHEVFEPDLQVHPQPPAPQRIVREHDYSVIFKNEEGEEWSYEPENVSEFHRFKTESLWLIEVNNAGGVFPQHEEVDERQ